MILSGEDFVRQTAGFDLDLANALQDIVTKDEKAAKNAMLLLKNNRAGRATFLPLTAVNGRRFEKDTVDILEAAAGYIGIASDIVDFDDKYKTSNDVRYNSPFETMFKWLAL